MTMMTSLWIVAMWVFVIAGMYAFMNVSFWLFAQVFGIMDNYLQNRYWQKHGYTKMVDDKGDPWYVSETLWP